MFPETVCKDLEINTAGNADVVFSDDRMNTLFLTRWLFHIFAKACSVADSYRMSLSVRLSKCARPSYYDARPI